MAEVVIYTTTFCPFCSRAMRLLAGKGVAFTEIDVTLDAPKRAEMAQRAGGARTLPQIFIDGEPIGGSDDLAALESSGALSERLGLAS